ncbi:hypothetical protein M9458_036620, partial [Cirrhinus mrigala]
DKTKYPSFLRTITSDYYQSRALAELVRHFGWTWVGAIRTDDDYGNNGMATFTKVAEQMGICLEYSLPFYRTYPEDKVIRIIEQIKSSTSRVIVGFLVHWDLEVLLHKFVEYNITGYQWVGTEGWISDSVIASMDKHHILQGAVGLAIPKTQCKYSTKNDSVFTTPCTGKEELSQMQNTFTDMSLMPIFSNVYKGVYAVAHTLHDLLGCKEKCASKKQLDPLTVGSHQ